ncbi:DUF2889 domain-containing protein [Desulfosporosinus sp. BICA1-9]|uniref:DUF2889 domain-containing protein n=1 Tax=Desulfosporosinus sp. BICA1-9 TaxID=1531958 RepID=UPI00054BBF2C|nr:DUF2889 domain-containing protein [Desulfosporosinus sp. BICA1-9]KJS47959.1 MAG: hypothetical protein VR66_16705 [Peptococcaceae bacterium BRH_c23]KJS88786.1 MAG: hypothetical protein JL57_10670 [Desulfosporosinus sp. BICA1-9]HBW34044.1 DUF2889 domain-containing protein [Desulfosporosinus sp.]
MKNLFQRNWYTEVRRSDNGLLKAKTSYVDTYREAVAHLIVDVNSFVIQEALWEEQRSTEPINARTLQVTPLCGSEAYFSSGPALKEAAAFLKDPLAVALFSETIKGIIQAETFLLDERGYTSEQDYENKWIDFFSGSCRFFSSLDRITKTWYDHVGESKRDGNLFVRFKTQSFFDLGEKRYLLTGNLSDSFHEVNVKIKLDGFMVEEADGILLRAPDLVCREAAALLVNLHGINLREVTRKELVSILGKGQGCVHVIDSVSDCAYIIEHFKF